MKSSGICYGIIAFLQQRAIVSTLKQLRYSLNKTAFFDSGATRYHNKPV
jgi:hypothetical protein